MSGYFSSVSSAFSRFLRSHQQLQMPPTIINQPNFTTPITPPLSPSPDSNPSSIWQLFDFSSSEFLRKQVFGGIRVGGCWGGCYGGYGGGNLSHNGVVSLNTGDEVWYGEGILGKW
jgi:hypothetical protein